MLLRFLAQCESYGIRLAYGEVYANPTIRQLAAGKDALEPVVFLRNENEKTLLLMVPFAGGSPASFWKYPELLKEKVKAHGLENSVVFGGRRNDIPDFLKFLDVLIIPSVEGFLLAGLEAALAGTTVVACNVAGAEEFIEVSGDGMTFKEDDAMDAATCIERIVSNRDGMVKIGQLFANNSSMESYAERLERLF